ncbi:MAG: DNA polymerase III subunit gamma/tau [bacterium]
MSYVVLARKWRPRQFDEVVGQEHVARTLSNAIEQDRVAHAFLFTGARGVGKTSTARILAKALNCVKGPTPTPCNECTSCVEITTGQSVDVFEIDGASNRGINEIRELRESVRYAPSRAKYKVYIIDEVHMLTTEAFNALLKTLEEPPPHVKFIFATTEPQKIPVTILSRCQRYDFKRIGQSDIVRHLELLCDAEKITFERSALQIIARQAAGGMRDALSLLDQIISFSGTHVSEAEVTSILGVANRQHLFDLSDALLARDAERALMVLDEVNRYGYDLPQFASELVSHFRDLMVISVVNEPARVTDLTVSEIELAQRQTQGVSGELLHRYFSLMVAGAQEMARSSYPKLILEMTLVRLAQLEPLVSLDLLVDRLASLEAEFDGEPAPRIERQQAPAPKAAPASGQRREAHTTLTSPETDDDSEEDQQRVSQPLEPPAEAAPRVEPAESKPSETPVVESEPVVPPKPAPEVHVEASPPNEEADAEEALDETSEPEDVREFDAGPSRWDDTPHTVDEPVERVAPVAPEALEAGVAAIATEIDVDAEELAVDAVEIQRLSPAELEPMSPLQRRDALVNVVRTISKPLAAVLEYAYVESFESQRIEFSLADKYIAIIKDEGRLDKLREIVRRLFGPGWVIDIQTRDDTNGAQVTTISQEREAERDAQRKALEAELLESLAVRKARELFNVESDRMRVQVRLFDDY